MGKKAGRPKGKPSIDWDAAERLYVQGDVAEDGSRTFPTYGGISHRMGVGVGTVAAHGSEDDWPAKREAFRAALQTEIERKCIENGAQAAARAVSLGAETAGKAARLIDHLLGVAPPAGHDPKWVGPTVDTLDRAVKLGRLYKDLATGARYLTGGVPSAPGAGSGSGGGGDLDEPPFSEQERLAILSGVHDANQSPDGPDGAGSHGGGG